MGDAALPKLVPGRLLSLPGRVGASALAACGTLAAGDDRGEAGLWDADGARRCVWRLRTAVAWTDVAADGARAVFVGADGETLVAGPDGTPLRLRVAPGDVVLLDRAGKGLFALTPAKGSVVPLDARGRPGAPFSVPAPVHAATALARTGGIAALTRQGMLGRFAPWGALAWGGDYRRYAAGIASDPQGELLVVCFLAHGAEVLHPSSGARRGLLDLGRAVECAAASSTRIALGGSDGTVALLDRDGRPLALGRAPSKVVAIGVDDAGRVAVRLGDGTLRTWTVEGTETPAPAAAAPHDVASPVVARRALARHRAGVAPLHVTLAPDGSFAAVAEANRRVALVGADGALLAEDAHEGDVLALKACADGRAVAVTTREVRRFGAVCTAQVRRLTVEAVRAAWSPCGGAFAWADELGAVRFAEGDGAADLASLSLRAGESVERLFATTVGVAFQTRTGAVRCLGAGWERDVAAPAGAASARLAGATSAGPVLVAGDALVGCGWDGRARWTHRPKGTIEAALVLPDDRCLLVLREGVQVVARDGRAGTVARRPEGDLAAAGGGEDLVVAWRDGRRLTLSSGAGTRLAEETFDDKVLAAAVARDGRVAAALLDGALALVAPAVAVA